MATIRQLVEEGGVVPTNNVGGGAIAGVGIGPDGEPGVSKKRQKMIQQHNGRHVLRRSKFAGKTVFEVDSTTFHNISPFGKKKFKHWRTTLGEMAGMEEIREFANLYPREPIIMQNATTGAMQYIRYGG